MAAQENMAKAAECFREKGTLKDLPDSILLGAADDLIEALKRHTTKPCSAPSANADDSTSA